MSTPQPQDECLHQSFINLDNKLLESEAEDQEEEIGKSANEVEVIDQEKQDALVCDSILKSHNNISFKSFMTLDSHWGSIGKEAPDWIFVIFIMGAFLCIFHRLLAFETTINLQPIESTY